MAKIVVGMSGGVDSSVAAYLLKEQGHEVIGLFMKNWHDGSVTIQGDCPWVDDSNDALIVAQQLGIPFQTIDLSEDYKHRIVDYMFAEYERGRTPNPDVLCNREIKFDSFLKAAISLGADYVATGHYCRKAETTVNGKTVYRLLAGKDGNKDQSYFLCQVSQEQLAKALFPVGELTKSEVRAIAEMAGLATAKKKDSQGLCFVGKVRLPEFLQQQLKPKPGPVVLVDAHAPVFAQTVSAHAENDAAQDLATLTATYDFSEAGGKVIGQHEGAHFYTIGQRKGLHIGGFGTPLFIIGTDTANNIVYVGQGEEHPGLNRSGLFISEAEVHWVRPDRALQTGEQASYRCRIRYRQALEHATLFCRKEGIYILFERPQRGIASGQFAAWYDGEELVGSGVIG